MQTKLTLRLEERLIRKAKAHAKRAGKSVSQMVAEYFSVLDRGGQEGPALPPNVRGLKGALRGHGLDREGYRRHLEDKYR